MSANDGPGSLNRYLVVVAAAGLIGLVVSLFLLSEFMGPILEALRKVLGG